MEIIITKGQIEDIEVIAQFQVDIAMESEGTLPDKRTQSLQAYKSGLSYKGKDIDFKLANPEPGFFDVEAYTPFFREHCKTCGSRMTCNGSWTSQASPTSPSGSNCGNCEKE